MNDTPKSPNRPEEELVRLSAENQSLRALLEEAQETLRAIREGAVDALVIETPQGERVFTLQGGEHPYRALIEQMREGAVTLAAEGVVHYCNQHFAAMLKLPLERVMGARMEQFVVPADHARLAAMLGEKAGRMELTLAAADATEILVLVSAAALRAEGPTAVCLVVTDLTERHRHEAAIRRLNEELEGRVVERTGQLAAANWELVRAAEEAQRQKDLLAVTLASIGDGVIVTDAEGRVTFLNGEAERLTGWSNEEAAGQPLPAVFHIVNAETRQPVESPVEKVLRLGTVVGLANHTCLIARDGRETPIDDSGAAIRQNDGAVRGVVLVFRDFTEKKRAEEELELARTAAENANWAKSRFLANVSHELRTLMNAILGLIELALPKQADPTAADFLKTAKDSADLLLSLLNDLLDSAKIEAGKLELESVPFSLRRVLDQTAQVLGVRASEKGISFSCRIRPDVPDLLVGDQLRLRQVLLNLAGNGIKFTERGEVVLSVEPVQTVEGPADLSAPESEISNLGSDISSLQSPMCHLQFAVRDTGIGISAAELDHIFRPFAQADLSTARRFGGTGLGLTICSNLVAMMGGRLWAHSEVGRGSTFYFTVRLPLAAELPGEDQTPDVRAAAASQLRILLAEDNPANQKLATYILRSRGHTIDVAGDGQQALRMTQENHYDAILMDVQMSGMDGLEATAAIREGEAETCRMPIIAMTAHAMKEDRERCLAAGMDGYLSKPIDAREMIALVERLAGAAGPSPDREERVAAPSAAAFDPASALKQCLSKPELLRQMIQIFIDDADKLLPQIRAALERGNLVEVGNLGHRLKGTITCLAAQPAKEAATRVEKVGLYGGTQAEAEEAVKMLERECRALRSALAEHQAATCQG